MSEKYPRLATMHYGKGYRLNIGVRHPTPALLMASEIGVLTHESEAMRDAEDRDAILVTGYGVVGGEAREAAFGKILSEIGAANPDVRTLVAFSSEAVRSRIKKDEGVSVPSPDEALVVLRDEGYTRVAVAPMNLFPGLDYSETVASWHRGRDWFKRMTLGTPLLYWMGQEEQRDDFSELIASLISELGSPGEGEALLLMAHGTLHPSNSYYTVIQTRIDMARWKNVFVYTMGGWPRLSHIIPVLKERGVKKVRLAPLMFTVGSHATRDMAGDGEGSHKSVLLSEGFSVEVQIRGLAEMSRIRAMYAARAGEALYHLRRKDASPHSGGKCHQ